MSMTYNQAVEQTITAGEQIHQIVNGTATTEVTVEDGNKVPSIRKALLDNFYFKDPIAWQVGQTENVFNQLRQFTDGSWWYAPSATASNPVSMGSTPVGDVLWKIYDFDAIGKLTPQIREALRRSYAEAGYNLVAGSFEAGGTLVNANDVLLQERTGKAFSGPAGTVAAGTNPASGGFVDKSGGLLRYELSNVEERLLGVGAKIYRGSNGQYVQNGDVVPAETTHLHVLVGGEPTIVSMSPVASGLVSGLTETGATIGGIAVTLSPWLGGLTNYQSSSVADMLQGLTVDKNQIALALNQIWSSGGTKWRLKDATGPITLDNFRVFNDICILDFYDDSLDYTVAIQASINAAKITSVNTPTSIRSVQSVWIPGNGEEYLVSGDIEIPEAVCIRSGGAILKGVGTNKIFSTSVFNGTFEGITFTNFAEALSLDNNNVNSAIVNIKNCFFVGNGTDLKIKLQSTITNIIECKFRDSVNVLDMISGDMVNMKHCWIQPPAVTGNLDYSPIRVKAGYLHMADVVGVPGVTDVDANNECAWVSVSGEGRLKISDSRFGGENGGMTLVNADQSRVIPTFIRISDTYSGVSSAIGVAQDDLVAAIRFKPSGDTGVLPSYPNDIHIKSVSTVGPNGAALLGYSRHVTDPSQMTYTAQTDSSIPRRVPLITFSGMTKRTKIVKPSIYNLVSHVLGDNNYNDAIPLEDGQLRYYGRTDGTVASSSGGAYVEFNARLNRRYREPEPLLFRCVCNTSDATRAQYGVVLGYIHAYTQSTGPEVVKIDFEPIINKVGVGGTSSTFSVEFTDSVEVDKSTMLESTYRNHDPIFNLRLTIDLAELIQSYSVQGVDSSIPCFYPR